MGECNGLCREPRAASPVAGHKRLPAIDLTPSVPAAISDVAVKQPVEIGDCDFHIPKLTWYAMALPAWVVRTGPRQVVSRS